MPEFPDVELYLHALRPRVAGAVLEQISVPSPFVLRTVEPSSDDLRGRSVVEVSRIGKRITIGLDREYWIVIHPMIAGRLRWSDPGGRKPPKSSLAIFSFSTGTLVLTEAGSTRRASLHLVQGRASLGPFARGGLDVFTASEEQFRARLASENHTLKRALTDPRMLDGVGNAYSDEILHRAALSPLALTSRLSPDEWSRLFEACRTTLAEWRDRLIDEAGAAWPDKVTAFRPGMAVHGRYGQPCPACATPVQRIRYAGNETNYCPACQTRGRLLADRALSRLLREDWPRTLEEMEELRASYGTGPGP